MTILLAEHAIPPHPEFDGNTYWAKVTDGPIQASPNPYARQFTISIYRQVIYAAKRHDFLIKEETFEVFELPTPELREHYGKVKNEDFWRAKEHNEWMINWVFQGYIHEVEAGFEEPVKTDFELVSTSFKVWFFRYKWRFILGAVLIGPMVISAFV